MDAVKLHLRRARARKEVAVGKLHHLELVESESLLKRLGAVTAGQGVALLYLEPDISLATADLGLLESTLDELLTYLANRFNELHPVRFARGIAMVLSGLSFEQAGLLAQEICKGSNGSAGYSPSSGGLVMCEPGLSVVEQIRRAGMACQNARMPGRRAADRRSPSILSLRADCCPLLIAAER